jgi:hypothetical protein
LEVLAIAQGSFIAVAQLLPALGQEKKGLGVSVRAEYCIESFFCGQYVPTVHEVTALLNKRFRSPSSGVVVT